MRRLVVLLMLALVAPIATSAATSAGARTVCTTKAVHGKKTKICRRVKATPTPVRPLFSSPSGIAVDAAGYVYVADAVEDHIVKLSPDGRVLATIGSRGKEPGQLDGPWGIAVDGAGNVYVSEVAGFAGRRSAGGQARVQKLTAGGRPLAQLATNLDGAIPCGLALDGDGNLYVTEYVGGRILKLSSDGRQMAQLPTTDPAPCGIALDPQGNLYVSQAYSEDVARYSPDGTREMVLGPSGTIDPPFGVARDSAGNILTVHVGASGVERLSPDGKVLASWGGPGTAPGQFHFDERQMLGIAVDGSGNVYVSDPGNARVQKFSLDGKLLAVWK